MLPSPCVLEDFLEAKQTADCCSRSKQKAASFAFRLGFLVGRRKDLCVACVWMFCAWVWSKQHGIRGRKGGKVDKRGQLIECLARARTVPLLFVVCTVVYITVQPTRYSTGMYLYSNVPGTCTVLVLLYFFVQCFRFVGCPTAHRHNTQDTGCDHRKSESGSLLRDRGAG